MRRFTPGSLSPIISRYSWRSSRVSISAICASIPAQIIITSAFSAATDFLKASVWALPFSIAGSSTLQTYKTGLAVSSDRSRCTRLRASSSMSARSSRTTRPFSSCALTTVSTSSARISSLLPILAARAVLSRRFSTVSRSFRHNSRSIISLSRTGLTEPSTCTTLSSSKQRTTCTMASTSRILAKNWLPKPSPLLAPLIRPAMSTISTVVGCVF